MKGLLFLAKRMLKDGSSCMSAAAAPAVCTFALTVCTREMQVSNLGSGKWNLKPLRRSP